ncbi:hypothetical protein [Acidithiobacillus ferriphilus]|uniref:hypothetical protein n=1 Tax=Acidithiobacillus ferriphilus TaxID=1689834 RepID=UPI002DBA4823|nr:hypothetical protein [Acidithiobacillus ferriphilus]MEB8474710.1 transglycosylase SLT domain-containing protein [Acidithiobacillus ferriphilus]
MIGGRPGALRKGLLAVFAVSNTAGPLTSAIAATYPIDGPVVNAFGMQKTGGTYAANNAETYQPAPGSVVRTPISGVIQSTSQSGSGTTITISGPGNSQVQLSGLAVGVVTPGQAVPAGAQIGIAGANGSNGAGYVTAKTSVGGSPVNPTTMIQSPNSAYANQVTYQQNQNFVSDTGKELPGNLPQNAVQQASLEKQVRQAVGRQSLLGFVGSVPQGVATTPSPASSSPSEDGIPVRVPVPAIIGQCETSVPPVIMTAIINQETHGNPYEIYDNTAEQSLTFPSYAAAVATGEQLRAEGHSVDEGITQVNSVYHPQYSCPYLFTPCTGIKAGAHVFSGMWQKYGAGSSNILVGAYRSIEHYNGNAQSSKCYGEEALMSIGINIGLHECGGTVSARGREPEILKIEDAAGGYLKSGTAMVNGGIVSVETGANNIINLAKSTFDGSSTNNAATHAKQKQNSMQKKANTSTGLIDAIIIVLAIIALLIFLLFTGAMSITALATVGSLLVSGVSSIASSAAAAGAKIGKFGR